MSANVILAERVGFEPTVGGNPTPDFESGTFDHSATSPESVVFLALLCKRQNYSRPAEKRKSLFEKSSRLTVIPPASASPIRPCKATALAESSRCHRPAGNSPAPPPACGPPPDPI